MNFMYCRTGMNKKVTYGVTFMFLEEEFRGSTVLFNTRFGPFSDLLHWMNDVYDSNRVFNTMDCTTVVRI